MNLMKLTKIKKELVEKEVLTLPLKSIVSLTSTSETSENALLAVFISSFFLFGVGYMQHFFDSVRDQASNIIYLLDFFRIFRKELIMNTHQ